MKLDELRKLANMDRGILEQESPEESYLRMRKLLEEWGLDLANIYQELEMSSPYVNTHRDTSLTSPKVSLHSHTYGEVIYCRQTEGVEYLVGADRYRLRQGDIIFIQPGISHCPLLPENMQMPYIRDVIWLSPAFIAMFQDLFTVGSGEEALDLTPVRTAGTKWEFLGELFAKGVREEELAEPGWEAAVMGNTMMIIGYLQRVYAERSEGKIKAEKPVLLDRITGFVEQHFAEHIALADLAKNFYVSTSTISHLFKQKMGISFYRYVTQRRLIAAKTLIERGRGLENVALEVGFSDYSSFYRAFKQEFGISPRQYRLRWEDAWR